MGLGTRRREEKQYVETVLAREDEKKFWRGEVWGFFNCLKSEDESQKD